MVGYVIIAEALGPYLLCRIIYPEAPLKQFIILRRVAGPQSLCMVSFPFAYELTHQVLRVIEVPVIGRRASSIYEQYPPNSQSSRCMHESGGSCPSKLFGPIEFRFFW